MLKRNLNVCENEQVVLHAVKSKTLFDLQKNEEVPDAIGKGELGVAQAEAGDEFAVRGRGDRRSNGRRFPLQHLGFA